MFDSLVRYQPRLRAPLACEVRTSQGDWALLRSLSERERSHKPL